MRGMARDPAARFTFSGDYINRGPDSPGVVERFATSARPSSAVTHSTNCPAFSALGAPDVAWRATDHSESPLAQGIRRLRKSTTAVVTTACRVRAVSPSTLA